METSLKRAVGKSRFASFLATWKKLEDNEPISWHFDLEQDFNPFPSSEKEIDNPEAGSW